MSASLVGSEMCIRDRVEVRDIESLLGKITWFFLLSREALAVFRAVYVWVQAERAGLRAVLPREVLVELRAAAA
eukprot:7318343-Alexandrium_andersonii.AAC.1